MKKTTALPSEQFKAFASAVDQEGKQNDALASSIAKSRALFANDGAEEREDRRTAGHE